MIRIGQVIGIKPEVIEEYTRIHAEVWPGVLERIAASNIRNFTIFLRRPENLLFAYMEYHGTDWEADTAKIAADPETKRWWEITDPMQVPLETRAEGEWWAGMEEVFHVD
ncbi:L-rhamnose mutarotase [Psychromarinibacter halotolerans]|uniref:L-rhamnose mutarotase n=1 Tax=Psychromarinibacter halotolerans TaxID=1775175 RepID=A0ABV7GW86_9RHOB|nr:L-rhamnose mutarotase [Psychromarinibacter halotolerans]MDF0595294.1 L-rhamnose mutarotase [Psychromarinibacter halotolerans]